MFGWLPIPVDVTGLRSSAVAIAIWLLTGLGVLMLGPAPAQAHAGHAADAAEMHDAAPLDMLLLATSVDPLALDGFARANLNRSDESEAPCAAACCAGLHCCAVALAGDAAGLLAPSVDRDRHVRPPYDWASRDMKTSPKPPRTRA